MAFSQLAFEQRVEQVAEAARDEKDYVSVVDVLVGLGWLPHARVEEWRQGRIACLPAAWQVPRGCQQPCRHCSAGRRGTG